MPALFLYISSIILSLIILNENFTSVYNTEVFYLYLSLLLSVIWAGAVVLQKILRGKMLWNTVTRPISIIINQFNNINFMGIDGRACPPKFEERRRARKFSSGEDISGCPPIYSHKAVMLSVTKHFGFMRFFTSFRMTANLLSVTWAGADVLQKFFGGRYLTTPLSAYVLRTSADKPEINNKLKVKIIKFKVEGNDLICIYRAGMDVLQKFFGGRLLLASCSALYQNSSEKSWN